MSTQHLAASLALLLISLTGAGAQSKGGYDLFQQALVKERTEGNLNDAILILKRITREFPADRPLVAKALLAMGQTYEKLENPEARNAYSRVMREFADQRTQATDAQARLVALDARMAQVGQTTRLLWADLGGLDGTLTGPMSADGRYLSFSAAKLTVLDLRSGTTFAHSNPGPDGGYVESSAISPDGRQVAYVWDEGNYREGLRLIQLRDGAASESRSVYMNDGFMSVHGWSPDGRSVVAVREQGRGSALTAQIVVISIPDGAVRVLRENIRAGGVGGASFSPDGRTVAYHARLSAGTPTDIYVVGLDGKETRVVEFPGDDRYPMWSPDGSHLVFISNRTGSNAVWMMPLKAGVASGPARMVKEVPGRFIPLGITRSGSLNFIAGSTVQNVHTVGLDAGLSSSGAPVPATNLYVNANFSGVWSPDGQYLAYHVRTVGGTAIRVRSIATGEDREVPTMVPVIGPMRWFPDGQSLLVPSADYRLANWTTAYFRISIASGGAELLHQTASRDAVSSRPDLSPDGKAIFYLENWRQAVRFDIEGRREARFPPTTQGILSLAVSPDGSQLAYLSVGSLAVGSATGGPLRTVVSQHDESDPFERREGLGLAWSTDQRHLFFVRASINGVWRVTLTGGEPENIGVSLARIRSLRVHPDGRRLSFDSVVDAPSELWVLENFLPKAAARR